MKRALPKIASPFSLSTTRELGGWEKRDEEREEGDGKVVDLEGDELGVLDLEDVGAVWRKK